MNEAAALGRVGIVVGEFLFAAPWSVAGGGPLDGVIVDGVGEGDEAEDVEDDVRAGEGAGGILEEAVVDAVVGVDMVRIRLVQACGSASSCMSKRFLTFKQAVGRLSRAPLAPA